MIKKIFFFPVLVISTLILMLRFLYIAKILNPEEYASYGLIILISITYGSFSTFGIQSILQRDMPILIFNKRNVQANILLMSTLIISVSALLIFFSISLMAYVLESRYQKEILTGIFHGFSQQFFLLLSTESKSKLELNRLSFQNFSRAIAIIGINAALINFSTSPYTLILGESFITLGIAAYIFLKIFRNGLYKYYLIGMRKAHDLPWKSGFIFMLTALFSIANTNLDKWVSSLFLSKADMGTYFFYWNIITIASALQVIVNAAFYPYIAKKYVQFGTAHALKLSLYLSFLLITPLIIASNLLTHLLEIIISQLFIQYKSDANLIFIFIFSSIFIFSNYLSAFLFIIKKEIYVLYITIITITLHMIFIFIYQLQSFEVNLYFLAYLNLSISITTYIATLVVCLKYREK